MHQKLRLSLSETLYFYKIQIFILLTLNKNTFCCIRAYGRRIKISTHLKKSFLQNSFPSRLKHLSVRLQWQSKQRTHSACQVRSSTFSRNLSRMGLSQPAHAMIIVLADDADPGARPAQTNTHLSIVQMSPAYRYIIYYSL